MIYRTILVAHDGSPSGDQALALALQLRHPDGRLVLVAVHASQPAATGLERAGELIPDGVPYRCESIRDSSVAKTLVTVAEAEHADLVVVGPTHRGRAGRALLGTTGRHVLHGAPCAVAVAAPDIRPIERIAVAYNATPEAELALDAAYDLAKAIGASVVLLFAVEPGVLAGNGVDLPVDAGLTEELQREARAQMDAACRNAPVTVPVTGRVVIGNQSTLLGVALHEADLVVAGSRGQGPLRRVLTGSVATALLEAREIPVLVTPRSRVARSAADHAGAEAV